MAIVRITANVWITAINFLNLNELKKKKAKIRSVE